MQEGIYSWHDIRTTDVAGGAAAKCVDDCRRASGRASAIAIGHDISRGVYKHGVWAGHEQVNRKSAAGVDDAAHLPVPQDGLRESVETASELFSAAKRQFIEEAQIEGMANVKVVVAVIVVVVEGIT